MIGGGGFNLRATPHRFGPPTVAYLALLVNQNTCYFLLYLVVADHILIDCNLKGTDY